MGTTSKLSKEQYDQLVAWRALALTTMPYMAAMLSSLRPVSAPGLGTFAVDKHHRLYVDFDAVAEKGVRFCAQALLHECCHLFGDHAARADASVVGEERRFQWNCAADLEINDDLHDAGCAELVSEGLLPQSFGLEDYKTAEWYMAHLGDKLPKQPRGGGERHGSGCGSGAGASPDPCETPGPEASGAVGAAVSSAEAERVHSASPPTGSERTGKSAVPTSPGGRSTT